MNKFLFLMCLLSCVFLTSCDQLSESQVDPNQATMPDEFLESRVDELNDLQSGWISTSAISVDMDGKIWIDPSATVYSESRRKYGGYLNVTHSFDVYVVAIFKSDLSSDNNHHYKWKQVHTAKAMSDHLDRQKVAKFSVYDDQ